MPPGYSLALYDDHARERRVALRTQQVIVHETGVTNTVDPLGGAYFVEKLTDEIDQARAGESPLARQQTLVDAFRVELTA